MNKTLDLLIMVILNPGINVVVSYWYLRERTSIYIYIREYIIHHLEKLQHYNVQCTPNSKKKHIYKKGFLNIYIILI